MISNVEARDVIIFVNRIDELADPAREVPEIRASIVETLRRHGGPTGAEIIFGCGVWAGQALAGGIEEMAKDSATALLNWAEENTDEEHPFDSLEGLVWNLSGMQALGQAVTARIAAGAGAQMLQEIEVEIDNLDQSLCAADAVTAQLHRSGDTCLLEPDDLLRALDELEYNARSRLIAGLLEHQRGLADRIENSRQTFVSRATAAVVEHLETCGDLDVWTYDPCGLRVLLRSSFQRYVRAVTRHGEDSMSTAAADVGALYRQAFDLGGASPSFEPPALPQPDPPVVLGQTIALDLRSSWWTRFWRRRKGYQACADDFARLIREETQPILNTLMSDNAQRFEAAMIAVLAEFLSANRRIILDMADVEEPDQAQDGQAAQSEHPLRTGGATALAAQGAIHSLEATP